jgi:hypothetical protein
MGKHSFKKQSPIMAKKRAKGGNVVPASAAARVEITDKCALVAVPVPNAPAKPQAIRANTINEALEPLNVNFKVQLRRLDGSTAKEKITIRSLDDFEEATIVEKSDVLREQKQRMQFLHDFQNELKHNARFREEIKAFLAGDKRQQFVEFLQAWKAQMKKRDSQFLALLRASSFSNN